MTPKQDNAKVNWLSQNRHLIILCFLVLIVMAISANQAWLNPDPKRGPQWRPISSLPLYWQYNMDSYWEFVSAARFPTLFEKHNLRVNRPLYPGIVKLISFIYYLPLKLIITDPTYGAAMLGYITFKMLIFLLFVFAAYKLLKYFIPEEPAVLGIALMLTSRLTIVNIGTFHTFELHMISGVFVCFLFYNLCLKYSHTKNFLFALLGGLLLLGRQNYAPYLACIIFGLYKRKWKETALGCVGLLLPKLIWYLFVSYQGYSYSDHEMQNDQMLVWVWNLLVNQPIFVWCEKIDYYFSNYLTSFGIYLPLAFAGLTLLAFQKNTPSKNQWVFMLMMVFTCFAQIVASKKGSGYIGYEIQWWIMGSAAYAIVHVIRRLGINNVFAAVWGIVGLNLIWQVARLVNYPWIHPFDQ